MKLRALMAVVSVAIALGSIPGAGAAEGEEPLNYVALGDSYSAAGGNFPLAPGSYLPCGQSSLNFSHVIAGTIGANLVDVSCGGAATKHFTTAQYPGLKPQLDSVTADSDLVTMTIGGNDGQTLALAAGSCAAAAILTVGTGNPCQRRYGTKFDDLVENTVYPNVRQALQAVRAKAPSASVVILGYPWIMPAVRGCYPLLPIAAGDIPYMRALQAHLNAVIARAAAEAGVTFVDMSVRSDGHDACQPPAKRWVEPVLLAKGFSLIHPNRAGEIAMAQAVMDQLELD